MTRNSTLVREFDPARVLPFKNQPRQRFRGIKELAQSIKAVGQITPGKVILINAATSDAGVPTGASGKYDCRLIDGERRLRACALAGVDFRAEVHPESSEDRRFEISLAANFGKQDHDCIEIAHALERLQAAGRTPQEMADICGGKAMSWVYMHLNLLKLHPDVQAMLIPGDGEEVAQLAFTTAAMLAQHPHAFQLKVAKKIIKKGMGMAESRRMILAQAQQAGLQARVGRATSPAANFSSLAKTVGLMTHRLGVFVDMPGLDLRLALESASAADRQQLINQIDELIDALSGIADNLEKTSTAGSKVAGTAPHSVNPPTKGPKPFVRDYARN